MQFRLYLLDVSELEDDNLQQKALSLMDTYRRGKVNKYKTRKDRMHQIATGLLLQTGLLELQFSQQKAESCEESENIYICTVSDVIRELKKWEKNEEALLPIEAVYDKGENGKPFWNQPFLKSLFFEKQFCHFSISHSGQYAALAIADSEIGLDIQEPRETRYIEGGYAEFSRMESYVKCTGEGYAKGISRYKQMEGKLPDYQFLKIDVIEDYAVNLCYEKNKHKD